jgi:nucleoside 2-deoxyribosyltransferase
MRFYIASKLKNHEQVKSLANLLSLLGWEHVYDWTANICAKVTDTETLKSIGQKEYDAVRSADVVIVLTPEGGGTHVELGMAIAFNKDVYICHTDDKYFKCDANTSTFYWLPNVNHFIGSISEFAKKMQADYCTL